MDLILRNKKRKSEKITLSDGVVGKIIIFDEKDYRLIIDFFSNFGKVMRYTNNGCVTVESYDSTDELHYMINKIENDGCFYTNIDGEEYFISDPESLRNIRISKILR